MGFHILGRIIRIFTMGAEQNPRSLPTLTYPDLQSIHEDDIQACYNTNSILKSYKALNCSISKHHFGYRHREHPEVLVCSPRCLTLATKKLKLSPRASTESKDSGIGQNGCGDKCIHGGEIDVENFKDEARYFLPAADPSEGNPSRESSAELGLALSRGDRFSCTSSSGSDIHVILEKAYEKKMKDSQSNVPKSPSPCPEVPSEKNGDFSQESLFMAVDETEECSDGKEKDEDQTNKVNTITADVSKLEPTAGQISEEGKAADQKIWRMKDIKLSPSLGNLASSSISFTWSPAKFTIQAADDMDKIEELQEGLNEYCSIAPGLSRIPEVDDIVFAPYDDAFYRGQVECVDPDRKEVSVHFFDFGDNATVRIEECKEPLNRLMETHPIYGVIFNCLPPDCRAVEEDTKIRSSLEAAMNGKVYMRTEEKSGLEWGGVLMLEDFQNWNRILLDAIRPEPDLKNESDAESEMKLLPAASPSLEPLVDSEGREELPSCSVPDPDVSETFPSSVPHSHTEVPGELSSYRVPYPEVPEEFPSFLMTPPEVLGDLSTYPVPHQEVHTEPLSSKIWPESPWIQEELDVQKEADVRFTTKVVKPPFITRMSFMDLSPNLQDGCLVYINYCQNYKKMIISAQKDEDRLADLTSVIQEYAEEAPPIEWQPAVMDVVLAPYKGEYYRGFVNTWKRKDKDGKVNVAFMDHGDSAIVDVAQLRELSPEIASHAIYGVKLIVPTMADNAAAIRNEHLDAFLEREGVVEMAKVQKLTCSGDLMFEGKKWSDLVETEFLRGNY